MKKMDARTLKALRGSIKKWEKIYAGTGEDRWGLNCPLCLEFPDCLGCPVHKKTQKIGCVGSPWKKWVIHIDHEHKSERGYRIYCPTCKDLAKRELDFLKSLLPKGK